MEKKIIILTIVVSLLLVLGLSFLGKKEPSVLSDIKAVEISPQPSDWGDIPIEGGIVSKEFTIKNTSPETIILKKIVTSCMCTEAKIAFGGKESKFFGMEHPGDRNALLNFEIPANENAIVTVNFDPAAHGPSGLGVFDRVIDLTFNDPAGKKQLLFNGRVVSE